MDTETIRLRTVLLVLVAVACTELPARMVINLLPPPLISLGLLRMLQGGAVLGIVGMMEKNRLAAIGWAIQSWPDGVLKGAIWSMGFAVIAGCGMAIISLVGQDPIMFMRTRLPDSGTDVMMFFIVAGLIAPIAEELVFRGVLYTYARRWGVPAAMILSTAAFVSLHQVNNFPLTQIVGGLVFAAAYEINGNLAAPITIHVLGNLAIFTLSLG